ncbi:MAG: diguanylate cyclase [Wenzhouxiangellaceae bacterium]|nr:diguanylate cyclase [Wenzhouxiangellaceae bacterium]
MPRSDSATLTAFALGLMLSVSSQLSALNPDWQASQYLHDHFDRDDGLPAEIVWSVMQSRQGYLWLGTQNGLVRFDGVRFSTFNSQTDSQFATNDVRVVAESPNGVIWAGTYGGGALSLDNGQFTQLTTDDGLAHDIVYDIHFAADGATWFATAGGVTRRHEGRMQSWTTDDGLVANRVFRIGEEASGKLWFATLTGGLSHFDGEAFTSHGIEDGLDSVQVHLLMSNDSDGLIAGTYTGGLYRLENNSVQALPRGALPAELPMQSAGRDRIGNLWIGSYGGGLWRKNPDGRVEEIVLAQNNPSHVFDLIEDREGNIWLATMNGLHRLREGLFLAFGEPEGLADSTFVVMQDPASGTLWAGSEGQGLFGIEADGGIININVDDGLSSNSVSALMVDSADQLWVGTFGGGLNRINGDSITQISESDGLPSNHVFALREHTDGSIWIAAEGGVARMENGRVETLTLEQGLPDGLVRHILEDQAGQLWFSTPNGLARYDGQTFRTWTERDGLASNLVATSWQDSDGAIWIGMRNGGLARLHEDTIFQFTAAHGLPQQSVLAIVDDQDGNLWLSGSAGLASIARSELNALADGRAEHVTARLFDEADGLRSSQFLGGFQPAAWRATDGRLWFPTNRGLTVIDPAATHVDSTELTVIIEQIRVNNEVMASSQPLLQLPADARSIEIDYTAPRLSAAERIGFRYRLGPDDKWQFVGNRRTAYFTGLPRGENLFEIQALQATPGTAEPVAGAQQRLYRQPLWYQTAWFAALALTTTGLLGFAAYRLTVSQLRARQRRLEVLVDQRTRQLQEALRKVEKISRIDGLTGVANRRYFEENLAQAWGQAITTRQPLSVIMLDLDRFKQYNDSVGHQAGDECLQRVSAALEAGIVRDQDLVARYGGEEFIILLPGANEKATYTVAERIQALVRGLAIVHPDSESANQVTVSIGCATAKPGTIDSPSELVERADKALYVAKRAGRNRIETD